MNKHTALLEKNVLLNTLSAEEIYSCLHNGSFKIRTYSKSKIIHLSGDLCSKIEIILTGKVVVERIDKSGNLMSITEFYSDDILGCNLLFSKNPYYPMTITARQHSVILEINKDRLFALLSDNHDFLRRYLEFMAYHTTILIDKIKHYANRTIRKSVMNYLNYESEKQNSNLIKLNITKKSLAEKIGVQRTSLSRELAKMVRDGLILVDRSSITLLKQ